jgi:hypothetical protein
MNGRGMAFQFSFLVCSFLCQFGTGSGWVLAYSCLTTKHTKGIPEELADGFPFQAFVSFVVEDSCRSAAWVPVCIDR